MGTRADFYVGVGPNAEWLGSIAWDGYEWHEKPDNALMNAENKSDFRKAVSEILSTRKDATYPQDGWPWPWKDSSGTDYTYCFNDGKVEVYRFGRPIEHAGDSGFPERTDWPNMEKIQNVTFGLRSGLIALRNGKMIS